MNENSWQTEIEKLKKLQLYRQIPNAKTNAWLNLASNDYLGLSQNPEICAALREGVDKYHAGSAAARLLLFQDQKQTAHLQLEREIAKQMRTPAALSFPSAYSANLGSISALFNSNDFILIDRLAHASIIDGAKLSKAKFRPFKHNDPIDLAKKLAQASKYTNKIGVVSEAIFSMDGDLAPIKEIIQLKKKYQFTLIIDEAHAYGIIGANGAGLCSTLGKDAKEVDLRLLAFGKAAGLSGACLVGSETIIDFLTNKARSFIYTTAQLPAICHAVITAAQIISESNGKDLRAKLRSNILTFSQAAKINPAAKIDPRSPIIPIHIGNEKKCLDISAQLRELGIIAPAIRYPTTQKNKARLRISVNASHSSNSLAKAGKIIRKLLTQNGI